MKPKPIKIVHVLHSFDIGGLENGVVNLINHLDWERYAHTICCVTRSGRMAERVRRPDVEIIELNKQPGLDPLLAYRLSRVFCRLRPDIVHTRNWGTVDGIIGARMARVPVVIHGEHGRTLAEVGRQNRKRRWVRRALAPWVDQFVTVSAELRDWVSRYIGISGRKIVTIHNGVDLSRFSGTESKKALRHKVGFNAEDFLVGTVGRLDAVKDQAALIRALRHEALTETRIKLILVGDGPCRHQLVTLSHEIGVSDRTLLLGGRDDVPQLLQCLDTFALPSLSEGMSNTLLEAMASGLPVVATRVGGNIELVKEGENGFLTPVGDPFALATTIRKYVEDPLLIRRHGSASRQRAVSLFDLQGMVAAYNQLYVSLAGVPIC